MTAEHAAVEIEELFAADAHPQQPLTRDADNGKSAYGNPEIVHDFD